MYPTSAAGKEETTKDQFSHDVHEFGRPKVSGIFERDMQMQVSTHFRKFQIRGHEMVTSALLGGVNLIFGHLRRRHADVSIDSLQKLEIRGHEMMTSALPYLFRTNVLRHHLILKCSTGDASVQDHRQVVLLTLRFPAGEISTATGRGLLRGLYPVTVGTLRSQSYSANEQYFHEHGAFERAVGATYSLRRS